jgi:hypothetical protein
MPYYPKLRERSPNFRINAGSPLYNGLVFAGLGQHYGSTCCQDESPQKNHGTLTGYAGTGNTPADKWVFDGTLRRWGLTLGGTNTVPLAAGGFSSAGDYSISVWWRYMLSDHWSALITFNNAGLICEGLGGDNSLGLMEPSGNGTDHYTDVPLVVGGLYHILGTRSGTTYKLYLNGKSMTLGGMDAGYALGGIYRLGGGYAAQHANGTLFDPLVWNRIRGPNEVAALADPGNVDLRVGGVPLILPLRRCWPVRSRAVPRGGAKGPCAVVAGEVFVIGRQAGQIQSSGPAAGQAFTAGAMVGQING